jgi:hypothetical protein
VPAAKVRDSPKIKLRVPSDFAGTQENPNWRDELTWPVPPIEIGEMYRKIMSEYLALVRRLSGDQQRIAILALAPVVAQATSAFEVALYVDAESTSGIRVDGHEPEFDYLRGETDTISEKRMRRMVEKIRAPRLPLRRNIQVTSWWANWVQLGPSILSPDAVAISYNPLLISTAKASGERVAFRHGGEFLRAARARALTEIDGLEALSGMIVDSMMSIPKVGSQIHQRLKKLFVFNCKTLVNLVAMDLSGLKHATNLPTEIWAGSSGDYTSRGVGLEVIRRGGSVTRFDHGGTIGMTDYPEVSAAIEQLATTKHVFGSKALAANVLSSGSIALLPSSQNLKVVVTPALVPVPVYGRATLSAPARRKVVYCPTLLRGFRRLAFSILSDSVSLDWTLRTAETLADMPIDLLCKPHPEGVLRGREHPVSSIADTSYKPFEEEISEADLFVFDRCHSTAFWAAICTDRPVVYLEATPPALHPNVRKMMESRCRILRATFDSRNRPQIDPVAFREAVIGGDPNVDPAESQMLLFGQAA